MFVFNCSKMLWCKNVRRNDDAIKYYRWYQNKKSLFRGIKFFIEKLFH